jgi:hypothetical protein
LGHIDGGICCGRYHWICFHHFDFDASGGGDWGHVRTTGFNGFGIMLRDGDYDGDFVLAL